MNKAFATVTGGKVNRGAGYRLETIYGPKPYVDKIREVFSFSEDIWTSLISVHRLDLRPRRSLRAKIWCARSDIMW